MKRWNPQKAEQLIIQEGRTRRWLAAYCGVSTDAFSHYLAGRRNPHPSTIKLIAQALNVTEESLKTDQEVELAGP